MTRKVLLCVVLGLIAFVGGPQAQSPVTPQILGIGDLPGGLVGSAVRDATKVGGTIYAVGSSTARQVTCTGGVGVPAGCLNPPATIPSLDSPVVWTSSAGLSALPPGPGVAFATQATNQIFAFGISRNGDHIASQAHFNTTGGNGTNGVRVSPNGPGWENWALLGAPAATVTQALSDDGVIVYGQRAVGGGVSVATRYDFSNYPGTGAGPTSVTLLPLPSYPDGTPTTQSLPTRTSSDGNVLVGVAANGAINATSGQAFRYVYGTGPTGTTTAIPRLDGGTWNFPVAMTPDGTRTVVAGNSPAFFVNGEIYLYDTSTATPTVTALGTPSTFMVPKMLGGITADGQALAVTFTDLPSGFLALPSGGRYAYVHNTHGWFHLASILTEAGLDLVAAGWHPNNLLVSGIRSLDTNGNGVIDTGVDVELVFGQGQRRTLNAEGTGYVGGAQEGFVVELPAGTLAGFNPTPVPPADESVVGAWAEGDAINPTSVVAFSADGWFVRISNAGFERGLYTWEGPVGDGVFTMTTFSDTDGSGGLSGLNGVGTSQLVVSGDTWTRTDGYCPGCAPVTATRITGGAGTIAGGWVMGDPAMDGDSFTAVFHDSGTTRRFFFAESEGLTETGTWTWDSATGLLTTVNEFRNGQASVYTDVVQGALTADELGLQAVADPGPPPVTLLLTRIVAPSTVMPAITNTTLEASGAEDTSFSFTVTAVNALTFEATGLPAGLSIDPDTGTISGAPAVNGTFNVEVTVTNTLGSTTTRTLVLTFAAPPASFHGFGDLPGGAVGSAVRDATRVNGTLYAVGSSVARNQTNLCNNFTANDPVVGCLVFPNLESPAWWRLTGSGPGTLAALPEPATHTTNPPTNQMFAYAISNDAVHIAGQTHFAANSTAIQGIRYTNTGGTLSYFNQTLSGAVFAMSDDGATLYGGSASIARRIDVVGTGAPGTTATITDLPLPAGTTQSQAIARGTSSTGAYMVGVAWNAPVGTALGPSNGVAFRYTKATSSTAVIPTLSGGSWNYPVATSSTGAQAVVAGNSAAFPNGEIYLTDGSNVITATLGSPNTALVPKALGGITADGAIVVTFGTGGNNPTALQGGGRYAYVHNSHGWFHLSSALAAQGIDLVAAGWDPTNMAVTGVRTVEGIDLVFGQARRRTVGETGYVNGAQEGFVAELPAGTLAAFNPQPTPPSDQSIVGTWLSATDPVNPFGVLNFMADGTYVRINPAVTPAGFERGLYTWAGNAAGGAFVTTTLYDTDGTSGGSFFNGVLNHTFIVTGDTMTFADTNCPGCATQVLPRVAVGPGSIVGGWTAAYPTMAENFLLAVFTGALGGNKSYVVDHGPLFGGDGVDVGTYSWDAGTGALVVTPLGGSPDAPDTATLARDELGLQVLDDNGVDEFALTRIVAPSTVLPEFTGELSVSGTVGFPFSFPVATTHALTVSAAGLPAGLSIDSATGVISGTPTTSGVVGVLLTAENTFGGTANVTLSIDVSAPAIVVVPLGDDVTVEPEVPAGTPDVTVTFDNVTGGGETTVAVIDPETTPELAPEPPGNFEIVLTDDGVPLYYDIQTTAAITGPTTICFSYAGVDFGGQTPRLFHYEGGVWVDITSRVDEAAQLLCGTTTSFSPFAIFKSTAAFVSATGFYAPVSPLAGFVNAAKAGSTVPLKFNVTLNGVEKTDISNLFFSVTQTAASICSSMPHQVDFVAVRETNLRYDKREKQFIQNWKLPKTTGCVIARITYKDEQQEVVLLNAKFSLKSDGCGPDRRRHPGPCPAIGSRPMHPYFKMLLSAVPRPDPDARRAWVPHATADSTGAERRIAP